MVAKVVWEVSVRVRAVIQRLDGTDLVFLILAGVWLALAALLTGALSHIAGILAGAFLTLPVTRSYSRRASDQLEEQAEELRKHVEEEVDRLARLMGILARYMEKDGLISNVKPDENNGLKVWNEQTLTGGAASYPRPQGPTFAETAAEPGRGQRPGPVPEALRKRQSAGPGGVGCSGGS